MKILKIILLVGFLVALTIMWCYRTCLNWMTIWTALAAIGSIVVAITAIYGDYLRVKFIGPKLKIVPHNLKGNPTTLTEYDKFGVAIRSYTTYYYHLKIINYRPFVPARNCRVILKQLHRRGPDREFHPEILVVPLQYVWSPAEWAPAFQTIADEAVLDFGRINQGDLFRPTFYITSANFKGFVNADDAVRFSLQIVSDNYVSSKMQVFQVAWNGKWANTPEEMFKNLVVSEINIDKKV